MEEYKTLAEPCTATYIEKKSRFIADIAPAGSEEGAQRYIAEMKARYRDARHHAYAYILKGGGQRCSDDGEPQGTAGLPVLEILRRHELTDVVAVVTRYFGGVLLGAPGLLRAYSKAASAALENAKISVMTLCDIYRICLAYERLSGIKNLAAQSGGRVKKAEYDEKVTLELIVPHHNSQSFTNRLAEYAMSNILPLHIGEDYFPLADKTQ